IQTDLLAAFPIGFLGITCLLSADEVDLIFQKIIGQCLILTVGTLVYASVRLAVKIMDIDI
ncbi:MAG: hypothetical protein AB7I30_00110, partial [Isosphaeraceae bacterium]